MAEPCDWLVDPSDLCSDWDGYTAETKATALALATRYLWGATGRQYGPCPVTVRPSQGGRSELVYQEFAAAPGLGGIGVPGGPFLFAGRWFNAGCATACCGTSSCAIVLRGPVAGIEEVMVGGEVVPSISYRVDIASGAWLLVRTDGECWPMCQNFTADSGEPGSFEVTYLYGREVPDTLLTAAGKLACEWAKGLTGGPCKLPSRMTRLSRQGVEIELDAPDAGEKTGIMEVDMLVTSLNPGRRASPPVVMSLDLPEACDRFTVFSGGS